MYFVAREARPLPLLVASSETLEAVKVEEVNAERDRASVRRDSKTNSCHGRVFRCLERRCGDARDNFAVRYAPRRIYGNPVDAFYRQ